MRRTVDIGVTGWGQRRDRRATYLQFSGIVGTVGCVRTEWADPVPLRPLPELVRTLGVPVLLAFALLLSFCGTAQTEVPSGPMYQAAKRQWLGSGLAGGSAGQNVALPVAVRDLRFAESTDAGQKGKYHAAIAELEVIERMPAAMVSPQEDAEWRAEQTALDRFFKVPQSVPYAIDCDTVIDKAAAAAWGKEPANASSGVIIGPLREAVAHLEPGAGKDPCYAAAIDDLTDLESATRSMIAQDYRPPCEFTVVGDEIYYLDEFFWTAALAHQNECQA